ncbi:ketosteroid isomerase-like protein [Sinorhizobium meliloti]
MAWEVAIFFPRKRGTWSYYRGQQMLPEETLKQYEAKINMHDFDELVPLISPNAIFWFNDGSFCGLKQIRQAFEETWQKFPLENYWLENLEWVAQSRDCAGCTYHFRWKAVLNGSALEGGGRGTTILRREANVWKIIHEHLSQFPKQ